MRVERYKLRHWAVYDDMGKLVVVAVYKRGAQEVMRRLTVGDNEDTDKAVSPLCSSQERKG